MNISCIITDDEPMARKGLENYVQKIPFLQLEAVCEDAMQLNHFLQKQKVDLVFLDIEMPYLSGIGLLKTLQDPPRVILTTAYENYALQGFELDVLDYLLKPISFERFLKAANKASDYFALRSEPTADYFFIKADGRMEKIFFKDIISVEARENYAAIHTAAKKWMTHATLKSVQSMLPGHFVQPHKSWLVNSEHITAVEGNVIYCGAQQIPVSKYQKEEVLRKILNGRLLRKE
jgi:DNA-binding LytR/AlgR family response regulator